MKSREANRQRERPTAIDWQEVHQRLESAQVALESGLSLTSEEKKRILKARAKLLAREAEKEELDQDYLGVVEFLLAYETYAIESAYVREVYPLIEITPLPGTPPFIQGIVNIRGQILSVIDLKKFFELPEKGLFDLNKIIIVRDDNMEFGILADAVLGIRKLAGGEVEAVPPTLTGIRAQYLKGVTRERMVILDAAKILSDKNIIISEGRETK
jgi:purine-binding chemotaxis protein CheW